MNYSMSSNRTSILQALAVCASLLAFVACSNSNDLAGGGIETTNGGVALLGKLERMDGSPAVGARIVARDLNASQDSVVGKTDAQGKYKLALPKPGHWTLAGFDGAGLQSMQNIVASTSNSTLQVPTGILYPFATLEIQLLCGASPCAGHVEFPGLGRNIDLPETGHRISGLPRSPLQIKAVSSDGQWSFDGKVTPSLDSAAIVLTLGQGTSIRMASFDVNSANHEATLLPADEGRWFIEPDTGTDLTQLSPQCLLDAAGLCFTEQGAWAGKSLFAQFTAPTPGHTLRIGMNLRAGATAPDSTRRWVDLSRLDSLSFYARGSGQVRMVLVTASRQGDILQREYGFTFGLSSNWTYLRLSPGTLDISDVTAPSWPSASTQVAAIVFIIPQDTEFWIDDLSLHGISFSDLQ